MAARAHPSLDGILDRAVLVRTRRRYLSETSMALVVTTDHPNPSATTSSQEVAQLTAS
jgi:hypothetical protein